MKKCIMNIDGLNNLCLVEKVFFMKEMFFPFTKNFYFSSRKTIFLKISKT